MPKLNDKNEVVLSIEEYADLVNRDRSLQALEFGGVDNWEGREMAYEDFNELSEEEIVEQLIENEKN